MSDSRVIWGHCRIIGADVPDLAATFARAERAAVLGILRSKPDVSLSDLRILRARGRFGQVLCTLTLREIFTGKADETIDPITYAPDKRARRQRYEGAVLEILTQASEPLSADEVATQVGGTAADARHALQRLAQRRRARRVLAGRTNKYVSV